MIVEVLANDSTDALGRVTLQGIRFQEPDGSLYIPRANGRKVPFSCACDPPDLLATEELAPLVELLCLGGTQGNLARGRRWRMQ